MKENITTEEWLERGKWTKFLLSLPLGKSRTFVFEPVGEYRLQLIRVTASGLSNSDKCDRTFSITVDANREYFSIKANKKQDEADSATRQS